MTRRTSAQRQAEYRRRVAQERRQLRALDRELARTLAYLGLPAQDRQARIESLRKLREG